MLLINLRKILADRGVESHIAYLRKMGLAHHTAKKLMGAKAKYLGLDYAERLCLALNCTPNDLLEWRPDAAAAIPANHPLQKLRPKEVSLSQQLRSLAPEQLDAVQDFIATLTKEK